MPEFEFPPVPEPVRPEEPAQEAAPERILSGDTLAEGPEGREPSAAERLESEYRASLDELDALQESQRNVRVWDYVKSPIQHFADRRRIGEIAGEIAATGAKLEEVAREDPGGSLGSFYQLLGREMTIDDWQRRLKDLDKDSPTEVVRKFAKEVFVRNLPAFAEHLRKEKRDDTRKLLANVALALDMGRQDIVDHLHSSVGIRYVTGPERDMALDEKMMTNRDTKLASPFEEGEVDFPGAEDYHRLQRFLVDAEDTVFGITDRAVAEAHDRDNGGRMLSEVMPAYRAALRHLPLAEAKKFAARIPEAFRVFRWGNEGPLDNVVKEAVEQQHQLESKEGYQEQYPVAARRLGELAIEEGILRSYGLEGRIVEDWKRGMGEGKSREQGYADRFMGNLKTLRGIEALRPGCARVLLDEFGIRDFGRYAQSQLVMQYDEREDAEHPYGVTMTALQDHNSAFYEEEDRAKLEKLRADLAELEGGKRLVRCIEVEDTVELARKMLEMQARYGRKPEFLFVRAHGNTDIVRLGRTKAVVTADLERSREKRFGELLGEDAQIVMYSCSTGAEGGIAQKMHATYGREVLACDQEIYQLGDMKPRMEGGKLRFDVTFQTDVIGEKTAAKRFASAPDGEPGE